MGNDSSRIEGTPSDSPDELNIPEEEMQRLVSAMIKTLELGVGAVYGVEDEGIPDAAVDCAAQIKQCLSSCCKLQFALTKDEVRTGNIKHNEARPFFIARDADGYCPHLDRNSLKCNVWEERPLRCRRYDCHEEPGNDSCHQ